MKFVAFLLLVFVTQGLRAQTPINRSQPVQPGQKILIHSDYPNLVQLSTWDKNEISVQGTVNINGGENDDSFQLDITSSGNRISIDASIRSMKSLPHRVTIRRNGQKTLFRSEEDYRRYAKENGKDYNSMSMGVDIDIVLIIKVPRNMETRLESVYGMVEVKDFAGPLTVEATYGGVDAALLESSTGELVAETNYGQIYTNLSLRMNTDGFREEDFHTKVSARLGTGPGYNFESKYGNVYLRKKN